MINLTAISVELDSSAPCGIASVFSMGKLSVGAKDNKIDFKLMFETNLDM